MAQATSPKQDSDRLHLVETAIENLPVGVGLFYRDGRTVLLNRKFKQIFHIEQSAIDPNATFAEMLKGDVFDDWKEDPKEYFRRLGEAMAAGRAFTAELEIGDQIISVHDTPIDGDLMLATLEDITARVRAERDVAHLAHHDPLTNLPNRAAFQTKLDETLAECRAKHHSFALLSVDLDRFKDVNDVFGHGVGDALLKEVARRFRLIAGEAAPARLGGDEFTFLSTVGVQPMKAASLAERLLVEGAGEMEVNGRQLLVSLSVGIAIFPTDGTDAASLLNNADAALYRAKADGRGLVRFYEQAMDERIHQHRRLQQDLRLALPRGELHLYYQPQAEMDGTIVGFEALVRWMHPTLGPLQPTDFIPLAEETGQIVDIGEWILREACREAASWARPLEISVNVSPIQFRHGDLAGLVHEILLETGLKANRLEIEITEGVLIENHARALSILRRIKALGVRIAMDDFGTGYSSLSYLQSFPFDKLKIDQSFVDRLGKDEHAKEIVRAVISLGLSLKLPTIAEGVETIEQLNFLVDAHCSGVQGFYIGRPEPIDFILPAHRHRHCCKTGGRRTAIAIPAAPRRLARETSSAPRLRAAVHLRHDAARLVEIPAAWTRGRQNSVTNRVPSP